MSVGRFALGYRSPLPAAFVVRLIGSIRRDCLNRVIAFNEAHLLRIAIKEDGVNGKDSGVSHI